MRDCGVLGFLGESIGVCFAGAGSTSSTSSAIGCSQECQSTGETESSFTVSGGICGATLCSVCSGSKGGKSSCISFHGDNCSPPYVYHSSKSALSEHLLSFRQEVRPKQLAPMVCFYFIYSFYQQAFPLASSTPMTNDMSPSG